MNEDRLSKRKETKYLVVHCSATTPSMAVDSVWIDRLHKKQGWACIGYHYVIGREGVIEVGRPHDTIGAHVRGHNHHSVGICLVGGIDRYGKAEDNFTRVQMDSLLRILLKLRQTYPDAKILGHRDLSPDGNMNGVVEPHEWVKVCPSFSVADWLRGVGIESLLSP